MRQVANGLAFLHAQTPPLLHRNLVPAGVLIDSQTNQAMLNIVKLTRETTLAQDNEKHLYLPEIIQGHHYTEQSDVYLFGLVMFYSFTGIDPHEFLGKNKPIPLSEIDSSKFALCDIVSECLHNDPFARPSSRTLVMRLDLLHSASSRN
jgi:serine/threonine protein kinase